MLTSSHLALLEERGLDPELLSKLGITSGDGNWIKIPYLVSGETVNIKHRTIAGQKEFRQETGARKCFWNVDCLFDETLAAEPLIITEGEFDAISALQAGFVRVVSVPDGAPAQEIGDDPDSKKYSYLEDAEPMLENVREIILCTDSDGPGINLLNDLALRLKRARCKWVKYPKGCKDLNDALKLYGIKGVQEVIRRAKWYEIGAVYDNLDDMPPVPERKVHNIGIRGLEAHYNVRPMDFCVITGIPSHGKTAFTNDVACRMAMNHGWTICFASFEQQPQIDHRRNLRTWHAGKRVIEMSDEEIKAADEWIRQRFCFVSPSMDDDVTLDWTLERLAASVIRRGVRLVVVDPWNEMDHDRPNGMTLTEYTGSAIKAFKAFALKYQVHVIVVAHPAKPVKEPGGKLRRPNLYDISDSAHWYNKADVGIVVHRDTDTQTTVHVAKSRYHDQIGKPGEFLCQFDPSTNRFSRLDKKEDCSVRIREDEDEYFKPSSRYGD